MILFVFVFEYFCLHECVCVSDITVVRLSESVYV